LTFGNAAQKSLHRRCGRLWKSQANVTAKHVARSHTRTYVESARQECFIAAVNRPGGCEGAMGHPAMRFRHERFIADVNVPRPVEVVRWTTPT
jgi:hypothetical protein